MKISVIIPIYNILDCLERCVMSVVNQTYRDLEILLVDDGSNDGTEKLVDELGTRDERIKVFHKENGGSSSARNLGLACATGDYIGFIDSDDYIEPDMYELLADAVERNDAVMAQISRDEVNEDGTKRPDICIPPKSEVLLSSGDLMKELLLHRGDCSFCTRITKRELFSDRQFPVGELNEDFKLLTNMLILVDKIPVLPKQCYHVYYRLGSNSRKTDKNDFSPVFTDCVKNADMVMDIVKSYYPELIEEAKRFNLYQRMEYLLHIPISQMTKENEFYKNVVKYIRKNQLTTMTNVWLEARAKVYLTLFAIAPKFVRVVHAKMRGL